MSNKKKICLPLNRVEGDLEIHVDIEDNVITDAWSSGIMYRGFEKIMLGRGSLDGLVLTPRICGICSTAHLYAAVLALDMITEVKIPSGAVNVRNLALLTEFLQNDMRQIFLMFTPDFANPAYKGSPLFDELFKRYKPYTGETVIEVAKSTNQLIEIIAILGGQWPHSSYMVPGGITSIPSKDDILQCIILLKRYQEWYEKRILGCSLQRWNDIQNETDLDQWLAEKKSHQESDLGIFLRFSKEIGLDKIGKGHDNFISYGGFKLPKDTMVSGFSEGSHLIPPGFARGTDVQKFDHQKISEHVAHSWFVDYDGGRHPFDAKTEPFATGFEADKYSWAKAPRYDGLPAETGPLAEMIIAKNPLVTQMVARSGSNALVRTLARLIRSVTIIPVMKQWFLELSRYKEYYSVTGDIVEGQGFGLVQAPRGALGHWVKIADGQIEHYQIITPTTWNGSPRDSNGVRGPWEEALIGTRVKDTANPVETGFVVRSFDPCLVCTVHAVNLT